MSSETYQWLADNVYAGFVGTRPPWWLRMAESEGFQTHTWDGPVPFDDVHELLASWQPYTVDMFDTEDGGLITTHKLVKASDTKERMAIIGIDHALHLYGEWLTGTVKECVGDEANISSAGMLRNRNQAWVTIERPESAKGSGGVLFSPFVTLSTSLDGSMATQINQNTQIVICDNTLNLARTQGLAFKHTSRSSGKLGMYRGVMTSIMQGETDFKAVLDKLLSEEVSDTNFARFMEKFVPIDEDDRPAKKTRSERKRQEITQLYKSDPRVAEWKGTAFGVVQAVNTWQQHLSQLRNATPWEMDDTNLRAMRNYGERLRPIKGKSEDEKVAEMIEAIIDGGHKSQLVTA